MNIRSRLHPLISSHIYLYLVVVNTPNIVIVRADIIII